MYGLSFGTLGNGHSEVPVGVLGLFSSLVDEPSKEIEFASEIVENALDNRIRLDGSFNIDAYEATIRKNQRLSLESKRGKQLALGSDSESEDDRTFGEINMERYDFKDALQIKDDFEKVVESNELAYAIKTIKALDKELQLEENIFILKVVEQALRGIPSALVTIKTICNKYKIVATQLQTILSSGKSFNEMFPITQ